MNGKQIHEQTKKIEGEGSGVKVDPDFFSRSLAPVFGPMGGHSRFGRESARLLLLEYWLKLSQPAPAESSSMTASATAAE